MPHMVTSKAVVVAVRARLDLPVCPGLPVPVVLVAHGSTERLMRAAAEAKAELIHTTVPLAAVAAAVPVGLDTQLLVQQVLQTRDLEAEAALGSMAARAAPASSSSGTRSKDTPCLSRSESSVASVALQRRCFAAN
jgi:hypothetical protein